MNLPSIDWFDNFTAEDTLRWRQEIGLRQRGNIAISPILVMGNEEKQMKYIQLIVLFNWAINENF